MIRTPDFWQKSSILSKALYPLSVLYAFLGKYRQKLATPQRLPVPVLCIGNIVVGGAGKTPTVISLVRFLKNLGWSPHILSRGYKSKLKGPLKVDVTIHQYTDVGDEPLLLARECPTWIGRNRVQTAKKAIEEGATILIMDDGFQNPFLFKDLSILVVDENQGFGNESVLPAGPLREPLSEGLNRADAILFIGKGFVQSKKNMPQFMAFIISERSTVSGPIVAFSGIGFPEKFRQTLIKAGHDIKEFVCFPDHHAYTSVDLKNLKQLADKHQAKLLTTEKDYVKLSIEDQKIISSWPVALVFPEDFKNWVQSCIEALRTDK